MKRFLFSVILSVFLLCPAMSIAADVSIAVVDVQKLLGESEAGKSIQKQIQSQKESFLAALSKEEQTLREGEKALMAEKEKLSKEEFSKKAKAFEEKLIQARQSAQSRKRSLDEAAAKAITELREHLLVAVQSVADEKGHRLVISRQDVVIGEKSLDITEPTMAKLNGLVQNIELKIKEN